MKKKHSLVNELRRLLITVKANYKSKKRRINKTATFLMFIADCLEQVTTPNENFVNFIENFGKADLEIFEKTSR